MNGSIYLILAEIDITNEVLNVTTSSTISKAPSQTVAGVVYRLLECPGPAPYPSVLKRFKWYTYHEIAAKWADLATTLTPSAPTKRLTFMPVCAKITTDVNRLATLSLKVPGAFNGGAFPSNGRILKSVSIKSGNVGNGDRIHNIRIEDTDRVIALEKGGLTNEQMQALGFINYPIILNLYDSDFTEANGILRGLFIPNDGTLKISPIDGDTFIPAGFYLKASITAAALGVPQGIGIDFFINIEWAGIQTIP